MIACQAEEVLQGLQKLEFIPLYIIVDEILKKRNIYHS